MPRGSALTGPADGVTVPCPPGPRWGLRCVLPPPRPNLGIDEVRTAPRSPLQSPYVEPLAGSVRPPLVFVRNGSRSVAHEVKRVKRQTLLAAGRDGRVPRTESPAWRSGRVPRLVHLPAGPERREDASGCMPGSRFRRARPRICFPASRRSAVMPMAGLRASKTDVGLASSSLPESRLGQAEASTRLLASDSRR